MKRLFLILAAGILCSCAAPKYQQVNIQPARTQVVAAGNHVAKAQESTKRAKEKVVSAQTTLTKLEKQVSADRVALELTQSVRTDVDALSQELDSTQESLKAANDSLRIATGNLDQAQKTIDHNAAAVAHAEITEKKYHKLKWGCVWGGTLLVGGLLASCWKYLLPLGWFGLGVGVGLPALVFTYLSFAL